MDNLNLIIFFLIIIFFNFLFFKNLGKISDLLKMYDLPDFKRKIHKIKTSQIGGLIFFFNFNIYLLFDIFIFNYFIGISYLALFLGSLFIFFLGVYDDKYNLTAKAKSFFLIITILFTVYFNDLLIINEISFLSYEANYSLSNFSLIFTIFCIFIFINALNMYDGINGNAGIYIICIFFYFLFKNSLIILSLSIILTSFFFIFNNLKNKVFLGDNGSLFISFLISLIIIYKANTTSTFYADEIFILMMLPGIDMARLFVTRIFKKRNPFEADNNHFHHLLMSKLSFVRYFIINLFILVIPVFAFIIGIKSYFIIPIFLAVYFFLVLSFSKNTKSFN